MPYVNIQITREGATVEQKAELIQGGHGSSGPGSEQESRNDFRRHSRNRYGQLGRRRHAGHQVPTSRT